MIMYYKYILLYFFLANHFKCQFIQFNVRIIKYHKMDASMWSGQHSTTSSRTWRELGFQKCHWTVYKEGLNNAHGVFWAVEDSHFLCNSVQSGVSYSLFIVNVDIF